MFSIGWITVVKSKHWGEVVQRGMSKIRLERDSYCISEFSLYLPGLEGDRENHWRGAGGERI